jgi:hypothetical protein
MIGVMLRIVSMSQREAPRSIALTEFPARIGRATDLAVTLSHEAISRNHCEIDFSDGLFVLREFGSRNGTFLNDQKIKETCALRSNDRIRITDYVLHVQLLGQDTDSMIDAIASSEARAFTSRIRYVVRANDRIDDIVAALHELHSRCQLIFCVVKSSHPLIQGIQTVESSVRGKLRVNFTQVLVIDSSVGVGGGDYDIESLYRHIYEEMKSQLGLDFGEEHHEQDLVQILRDTPNLLLCFLHMDRIPSNLIPRLRVLMQEGHKTIVFYEAAEALAGADKPADWLSEIGEEIEKASDETTRASPSEMEHIIEMEMEAKERELRQSGLPPITQTPSTGSKGSAEEVLKRFFNQRKPI